jgi:hypothetical protein
MFCLVFFLYIFRVKEIIAGIFTDNTSNHRLMFTALPLEFTFGPMNPSIVTYFVFNSSYETTRAFNWPPIPFLDRFFPARSVRPLRPAGTGGVINIMTTTPYTS